MAKRKNAQTTAEDYLNQLNWKASRSPSRFTSRDPFGLQGKFRIVPQKDWLAYSLLRLIFIFVLLGGIGYGLFMIYQKYVATGSQYALATFIIAIVAIVIVLVAVFDSKRKS
jgi:hypothetical protein